MLCKLSFVIFLVFAYSQLSFGSLSPKGQVYVITENQFHELANDPMLYDRAILIFLGSGGFDQNTAALQQELEAVQGKTDLMVLVDWSKDSANRLLASFRAQRVGGKLAKLVASKAGSFHVIGISVGAFAADAVVAGIKGSHPEVPVSLSLLDPFVAIGLDIGYGIRAFGKKADACKQYLNTDDPVPFTNKPLKHCAVWDVTAERPEGIPGHDWPLIFFTRLVSIRK